MRTLPACMAAAVSLMCYSGEALPQEGKYHDPGMKRVVQVAIVVRDIEATGRRWADLLGVPVPDIRTTRPGDEVQMTYRGKPSEGRAKLAFIQLGQVVLELIQPVGEGSSWKEFLDTRGEGVQHLGFQVVNIEETSAALGKAGMPVIHRGRYDSNDGTYIYHDSQKPLGVIIELLHSDPKK